MKLSADHKLQIQQQLQADPIPDDEPVVDRLTKVFGDHTFYVTEEGVLVWDWLDKPNGTAGRLIALQVASWTDLDFEELHLHEPIQTGIIINLAA